MPLPFFALPRFGRFLTVGVVNTLFAYSLFALLLAAGLQLFVAQFVATVINIGFNYVTYSRHVFADASASGWRFTLSYGLNYLVGLAALTFASGLVTSPYLAGLLAMVIATVANFLVLRRFVFVPDAALPAAPGLVPR